MECIGSLCVLAASSVVFVAAWLYMYRNDRHNGPTIRRHASHLLQGQGCCEAVHLCAACHKLNWHAVVLQSSSIERLQAALAAKGAALQQQGDYLLAAVPSWGGFSRDLFEFLFTGQDDNTVSLRALPGLQNFLGTIGAQHFLESLRLELGWENVVVLRGRTRALGVIESPFDTFGDPAPLDSDLVRLLEE
jgi:hypothetical protein